MAYDIYNDGNAPVNGQQVGITLNKILGTVLNNAGGGGGGAPSGPAGGALNGDYPNPGLNPVALAGDATGTTSAVEVVSALNGGVQFNSGLGGYLVQSSGGQIGIANGSGTAAILIALL